MDFFNKNPTEQSTPISSRDVLTNYDKIYLATKTNYYKLNVPAITKLTENLLFQRSSILNEEIEILYPNKEEFMNSTVDNESSLLFDKCIECAIDCEIVVKILWQRIYSEQIAMKFISIRFANYKNQTNSLKTAYEKVLLANYFN